MLLNSITADFFILIHHVMWHYRICLLLWFWLSYLTSHACICENQRGSQFSSQRIQEGLAHSQQVFIGEVISVSGNSYRVRPIDVFKGKIRAKTLTGFNNPSFSCSLTVTPGIWIFYTTLNPDGTIPGLGLCGLSTNLSNPEFSSVPPPPSGKDKATLDRYYAVKASKLGDFHKNWLNEYIILNGYRYHQAGKPEAGPPTMPLITYITLAMSVAALFTSLTRRSKA